MALIHWGIYRFADRIVGYRNDYCLRCESHRLALRHRSFRVVHIWFVPLIPLGWSKSWRCRVCGGDPHVRVKTRESIRWAGTIAVGLLAGIGWLAQPGRRPEDFWYIWGLRIGATTICAAGVRLSLRSPAEVDLAEKLRSIEPNLDRTCVVCGAEMARNKPIWTCPNCGVERGLIRTIGPIES